MTDLLKFDNDQSESNLCKALGAVLNTQIKLITNCTIRTKSTSNDKAIKVVILVVGSEKIYFYNLDFDKIQFQFCYHEIESIVEETSNDNGLLINLKDVKFKGNNKVPYVYMSINDRISFINIVKCYYSTYYCFIIGELKELKIKKKDFIEFSNTKVKMETKMMLQHYPPKYYVSNEVFNYKFFIPNYFKKFFPVKKQVEDKKENEFIKIEENIEDEDNENFNNYEENVENENSSKDSNHHTNESINLNKDNQKNKNNETNIENNKSILNKNNDVVEDHEEDTIIANAFTFKANNQFLKEILCEVHFEVNLFFILFLD
jgi:hypothetical protein